MSPKKPFHDQTVSKVLFKKTTISILFLIRIGMVFCSKYHMKSEVVSLYVTVMLQDFVTF